MGGHNIKSRPHAAPNLSEFFFMLLSEFGKSAWLCPTAIVSASAGLSVRIFL
jgi:hypothetical protein